MVSGWMSGFRRRQGMERPTGRWHRRWMPGFVALCMLCSAALASAGSPTEKMQLIKAAFILNIARFTEWSPEAFIDAQDRMVLCLFQDNPLGGALDSIRQKQVGGRGLEIETVEADKATPRCNILFIPGNQLQRFQSRYKGDALSNVLTISDLTEDHHKGGSARVAVTLVRDETRIAFEINLKVAKEAGIRLSSELLKLGRIVEPAE